MPSNWIKQEQFNGWQTKLDPTKIEDGATPNAYNTTIGDGDKIQNIQFGYESMIADEGNTTPISCLHTMRKRSGVQILMRGQGTSLQYYDTVNKGWVTIKGSYNNSNFGFAEQNINTDLHSYVYFGNAFDNYSRWNGAITTYASAAASTAGIITALAAAATNSGTGYKVGDILTITGGSGTATARVTAVYYSGLATVSPYIGPGHGTGYQVNDIVALVDAGGASGGTCKVLTVDGTGMVQSLQVLEAGYGYNVDTTHFAFYTTGGHGSGLQVWINSVADGGVATTQLLIAGSGYSSGTGNVTTGGTGTGCTLNISTVGTLATITKQGTTTWSEDGFYDIGNIVLGGVTYAYTGGVNSNTLSGITPDPSLTLMTAGAPIFQSVDEYANNPKGNIFMLANNRIFVAGITTQPQGVYFSKYGDATDFSGAAIVTSTTATSAGIFNLGEGGGAVVGMAQDEGSNYIFKKSITYKSTLSDSFYTINALKPFDGKSQTNGAVTSKSIFATPNGVIFVTADKKIFSLQRIDQIDYPQNDPISNLIKPTLDNYDFTSAVGITFKDKAYIACKSASTLSWNDVILVYNTVKGFWDMPIIGMNVSDWAIYDIGDGNGEQLYFGSANSRNVYKANTTPIFGDFDVKSLYQTKQYHFGSPEVQKVIKNIYIEGYIKSNTNLTIKMYLDEGGFTQTLITTFSGTETDFLYSKQAYNVFGFNPFSIEVMGSNTGQSDIKKFRIYLNKGLRDIPFYNTQLEFSSEGQDQQWSINLYSLDVQPYHDPLYRQLFRVFKNI